MQVLIVKLKNRNSLFSNAILMRIRYNKMIPGSKGHESNARIRIHDFGPRQNTRKEPTHMRILLAEDERDLNRIITKNSPPKDTAWTVVSTGRKP